VAALVVNSSPAAAAISGTPIDQPRRRSPGGVATARPRPAVARGSTTKRPMCTPLTAPSSPQRAALTTLALEHYSVPSSVNQRPRTGVYL